MSAECKNLTLSLALAESIACGKSQLELAEIASFLASLSSNISLIIQTRNVEIAKKGANLGDLPELEEVE